MYKFLNLIEVKVIIFILFWLIMYGVYLFYKNYCEEEELHFYYSLKAYNQSKDMLYINPTMSRTDKLIITDDGLKSYTFCTSKLFHKKLYKWKDKVYVGKFKRNDIIINGVHYKTGEPYKKLDK